MRMWLILLLCLCSCGRQKSSSKNLLQSISSQLKNNYNIEHGNLVVTYDLAKTNQQNLIYAKDYVILINDLRQAKLYSNRLKLGNRSKSALKKEAINKILKIKNLLLKLDSKYKFLSKHDFHNVHKLNINLLNNYNYSSLKVLSFLDRIMSEIPLMLPEFQPKITSHYGIRKHPINKRSKFHSGIDITGPPNSPIYAAAGGKVTMVERLRGYGNTIEITHPNKFRTRYSHLKKINVKKNETTTRGQLIAIQGMDGIASGEHLHFEIWLDNKHINPFDFLAHAY